MYKFLNLLWGLRFGGQTGSRHVSPEPRLRLPHNVLALSDHSGGHVALLYDSDSPTPTLARL